MRTLLYFLRITLLQSLNSIGKYRHLDDIQWQAENAVVHK